LPHQKKLKGLAETYAIRVREYSDAVATLGRLIAARQQVKENIVEVERFRALAEQAREDLFGALESPESRISGTYSQNIQAARQ
jgi:hypothetical protein